MTEGPAQATTSQGAKLNEMRTVASDRLNGTQTDKLSPQCASVPDARETLRATLNATAAEYPRDRCIHQLLEEQAKRTPNGVAVQFEDQSLNFTELHSRANQLARFLQKRGVKPEVLVGVCVERSLEMVVALLAILKAGGAYVPLDPAYPSDRIKYVLEDARVKVLITQNSLRRSLPRTSAEIVCVDDGKSFGSEDRSDVSSGVAPENLAYVIYTSGSTGKPKGVQLEHRSVVNFLCSMQREPGLTSKDTLLAVTTLSFDIAGLEMYLPLLTGARLVIAPRAVTYDGHLLMELLAKSKATVMQATPATWRLLVESGWKGDRKLKVLVGGEALSPDLARELASRCGAVWNMYGPTETTIWSSIYRVKGRDERLVPIGKPIANTTLYVLDADRRPVSSGSEGELYIGGDGLARGYFERPDLTAEKFIPDPFNSRSSARMYRTGDLVRCRPDGNVEFLGRIDHQVKIRGFRIELGEIEAVLEQVSAVRQAVVVAREDAPGDKRLVAYIVPETSGVVRMGELRTHLRKQLPDYMMPAAFVQLGSFPLTPNGKVDRNSLSAPRASDYEDGHDYVAPRDSTERRLAELWEEVLGIRPIGVTTSFFDLGGRSILAARLFTRIGQTFGRDLPLATLFQAPTVEQLAKQLSPQAQSNRYSTLVSIQPRGDRPPFFCVHGGEGSTLFLHRLAREMPPDQPFYGLEPEGLDGRHFRRTTIEQMAAHYLSEIRKVQAHGPYHIGGYCFGGIVAFEMAQQLRAQGETAALVALFSAPLRHNRRNPAPPSTPISSGSSTTRLHRLFHSPGQALQWRLRLLTRIVRQSLHATTCRLFLTAGIPIPPALRTMYVVRMINGAEQNYVPTPYGGEIALFHGKDIDEADPSMGWNGLAEHLQNFEIGDGGLRSRRDIMNEPLVALLAKQLESCLDGRQKATREKESRSMPVGPATSTPVAGPAS